MTTKAIAVLNRFNDLFRLRLPKATGALFAAKTRSGRYVKTFLFGVGVVLPLGSLIWVSRGNIEGSNKVGDAGLAVI